MGGGLLFVPDVCLVFALLALAGAVPLWISLVLLPILLIGCFFLVQVIHRIDTRWGEGARGEVRVGEELEHLHREG